MTFVTYSPVQGLVHSWTLGIIHHVQYYVLPYPGDRQLLMNSFHQFPFKNIFGAKFNWIT